MANYLLVHGGDRDGSVWSKVATILKAQGHNVLCPTMKSVKKAALRDNIDEIINEIHSSNFEDIILVGHSYGAMVITGVVDRVPDRIKTLIYIDSVIPKTGCSLFGMLAEKGINYEDLGLTSDKACLEELEFNQTNVLSKTKIYILCLQSEFFKITKQVYDELVSSKRVDTWFTFCLDTTHACMVAQPEQLAVILFGIQVL